MEFVINCPLRWYGSVGHTLPVKLVLIVIFAAVLGGRATASDVPASASNPVLATFNGGTITLYELEEFARETPLAMRIPFARRSGEWRRHMCGELAKSIALTSQARTMGLHLQPGYLRARDYFLMEYFAYLVLRDQVTNKMDVSPDAQQHEFETYKSDFWLSPTVTLRTIRVRSDDKMTSAIAALKAGEDFASVELKFSEVSPRYRGRILGPFPSRENRTIIPPPDEVISAAMQTSVGETTGPIKSGDFLFLVKTEGKTDGRQQTLEEVVEELEERIRARQSTFLVPALVDQIQKELGVVVDEALFASATPQADDLLATVGAFKLYRQEYTDLNGRIRGPANPVASMLPTKLKQFVLPYMVAEWARIHGYPERAETARAIYYYDLQHLAAKVAFMIAEKVAPPPGDAELRAIFQKNIADFRKPGAPEPRFEDYRDEILNAQVVARAEDTERKVAAHVLSQINFQMVESQRSDSLTAIEALVAAGERIPKEARILEIAPARIKTNDNGHTPYAEIGRAPSWRVTFVGGEGRVSELVVDGPADLIQHETDYTQLPAFQKWIPLCRFDTDSLKRHAIDKALGDFIAKHGDSVRAAAAMEFAYSKDDPTSPTDCLIVYSATPADNGQDDGLVLKYSAYDGELTKRQLGHPEGKCPTCPTPDLPSPQLVDNKITSQTEFAKGEKK